MNAAQQHTAGPWVCEAAFGEYGLRIEADNCGTSIGVVWVEKAISTTEKSELPYGYANARLIAAAPDLLAALERLITDVEIVDGQETPDDDDVTNMLHSIKSARAAILSATQGADK